MDRLEANVATCSLIREHQTFDCQRLMVHQSDDHTPRIRLLGRDSATGDTIRLTMVSRNPDTTAALDCNRTACRLKSSPWSGQVQSGSWIRFNARGLPSTAPRAELMTGECTLSRKEVICDSQTNEGAEWRAKARL